MFEEPAACGLFSFRLVATQNALAAVQNERARRRAEREHARYDQWVRVLDTRGAPVPRVLVERSSGVNEPRAQRLGRAQALRSNATMQLETQGCCEAVCRGE